MSFPRELALLGVKLDDAPIDISAALRASELRKRKLKAGRRKAKMPNVAAKDMVVDVRTDHHIDLWELATFMQQAIPCSFPGLTSA